MSQITEIDLHECQQGGGREGASREEALRAYPIQTKVKRYPWPEKGVRRECTTSATRTGE